MTEFEAEVRAHLTAMMQRPLTAAEQEVLDHALEQRRLADELVARQAALAA